MLKQLKKPQEHTIAPLKLSFLRTVGGGLRCHKLGSLLVAGGLVTKAELEAALVIHRETNEKLGRILVRQGVISAVQMYRKLAEQWCLKASTAGVAMIMTATTVNVAEAADSSLMPQFQIASASTPHSRRPLPKANSGRGSGQDIFGTQEVRSDDISPFKKWTAVINRFEEQMASRATSPRIMMWKTEITSLRNRSGREQIEAINDYINQVRYVEDKNNWGKTDYWATPVEFFSRGGDCEDFAIAKYASLRALGFSADQLRIAIVQDTVKGVAHAVLIVYNDGHAFVLDNQNKQVLQASAGSRYQPIFSINSNSWWLHKKAIS